MGGGVNGRLTKAPEGAIRSMNECAAAGRAAAEVGACAKPDAPPSCRGWVAHFIAKPGDGKFVAGAETCPVFAHTFFVRI